MPGDSAVWAAPVVVRPPCGTRGCAFGPSESRVGRLVDLFDSILWPSVSTFASVLPRCLSRLIRTEDSEWAEDDVVG